MTQMNGEAVGSFEILLKEEKIYLKLSAPEGMTPSVDIPSVLDSLYRQSLLTHIDHRLLHNCLLKQQTGEFTISRFKPHEINNQPQNMKEIFDVRITDNGMFARLFIRDKNGDPPEEFIPADLLIYLLSEGIIHGLKEHTFPEICKLGEFFPPPVVAEGTPPRVGEEATVRDLVEVKQDMTPTELEGEQVNFKSLALITMVKKGDVLQEKTPPTRGENGYDVQGRYIPGILGRDVSLISGDNVRPEDSGTKLVAQCDGAVQVRRGIFSVNPTYVVSEDVDYSTGNVKYSGDVLVRGTVRQGFEVFSDANIRVSRMVESGFCCTLAGDITVGDGANSAYVMAGGSVNIGYAEYSSLTAGKDVNVSRYTMDCNIFAEGVVRINSVRGALKGGAIRAGRAIVTPEAGSPDIKTQFIIKNNEIQTRLDEIERLLKRYREQYEQAQIDFATYQRKKQEATPMLKEVYTMYAGCYIEVKKVIHPGTTFIFADRELVVNKELPGGRITFSMGKILLNGEEYIP